MFKLGLGAKVPPAVKEVTGVSGSAIETSS